VVGDHLRHVPESRCYFVLPGEPEPSTRTRYGEARRDCPGYRLITPSRRLWTFTLKPINWKEFKVNVDNVMKWSIRPIVYAIQPKIPNPTNGEWRTWGLEIWEGSSRREADSKNQLPLEFLESVKDPGQVAKRVGNAVYCPPSR